MAIQLTDGGEMKLPSNLEAIYYDALNSGKWIKYGGKWYTPMEFAQNFGNRSPDLTKIQILNPILSMHKGRVIISQMIQMGLDKSEIIEKLNQLNKFTDKVLGHITEIRKRR